MTRLRIAAALLRFSSDMEADDGAFCAVVLRIIERLACAARDRLREHVDWVEAYEMEEARQTACRGSRR